MEILTTEWRCFIETARRGNISQAADRLHLPQPSVTKYVRRLEVELGVSLFQRSNRGVKLTETGERLFQQVADLSEQLGNAVRSESHMRNEVAGNVTFGTHPVIALGWLSERIAKIYAAHPQLKFEIKLSTSMNVSRLVAAGKVDYGLVANPVRLPGLVILKIAEEGVALFGNSSAMHAEPNKKFRIFYNPEMQRLPLALRKIPDAQLEAINDYELLGKLASEVKKSAALLPEGVARRYGLRHQLTRTLFRATLALIFRASIERTPRHRAVIKAMTKS